MLHVRPNKLPSISVPWCYQWLLATIGNPGTLNRS